MNEGRRQRLESKLDTLEAEWHVRQNKLKQLRVDFATEAGTAVRFQLERDIEAQENRLKELTEGIEAIEQELEADTAISQSERKVAAIAPPPTQPSAPPQNQPAPPAQRPAQPVINKVVEQDDLRSEKGIDYTRLRDLLKAGKWKEADRETYKVMIRAVGRESGDYFRDNELLTFPCTDLKTIDQLWVKYSQGKFGFSVQKQIYVDCGAQLDGKYPGDKIWYEFCDRVGWRVRGEYVNYQNLKADPSLSLSGESPVLFSLKTRGRIWFGRGFVVGVVVGSLLSHQDL